MGQRVTPTGKKWAKKTIGNISDNIFAAIHQYDVNQCRQLIRTCNGFTGTNCVWTVYWCKDLIIKISEDRIWYLKEKEKRKSPAPSTINN